MKKLTKKWIKFIKLVKANYRKMNKILKRKSFVYLILLVCVAAFVSCAGDVDSQLKKIAKEANAECPKMLDEWTRLDSCAAHPNKSYSYYHTVVNEGLILDADKFKVSFKPIIISIIRTNPAMKYLRENEVTLHYYYTDEVNKNQTIIVVTPEEYKNN